MQFNSKLHNFLRFTAAVTFLLLIAGALVTSNQAGLSVPDWPTSFGHLFKIPPLVGGVKYEHTHRMIAEFVGLLTIAIALWVQRADPRRWMRVLGWIALLAVIAQGVLGGLTVKLLLPWYVSSAHAIVAQTFFALLVAMALFTSRGWMETSALPARDSGPVSLFALCVVSLVALYIQLFFGAAFRHEAVTAQMQSSLDQTTAHHAEIFLMAHIGNALLVAALLVWSSVRAMIEGRSVPALRTPGRVVHGLLWLQITLGVLAYLTHVKWDANAPQPLPSMVAATVAHVAVGALLLAAVFVLAIQTRRHFMAAPSTELEEKHREAMA